jgi:hypothetical protein
MTAARVNSKLISWIAGNRLVGCTYVSVGVHHDHQLVAPHVLHLPKNKPLSLNPARRLLEGRDHHPDDAALHSELIKNLDDYKRSPVPCYNLKMEPIVSLVVRPASKS